MLSTPSGVAETQQRSRKAPPQNGWQTPLVRTTGRALEQLQTPPPPPHEPLVVAIPRSASLPSKMQAAQMPAMPLQPGHPCGASASLSATEGSLGLASPSHRSTLPAQHSGTSCGCPRGWVEPHGPPQRDRYAYPRTSARTAMPTPKAPAYTPSCWDDPQEGLGPADQQSIGTEHSPWIGAELCHLVS